MVASQAAAQTTKQKGTKFKHDKNGDRIPVYLLHVNPAPGDVTWYLNPVTKISFIITFQKKKDPEVKVDLPKVVCTR